MDGAGTNLKTIMQSKMLEVPFFQRPYVWEDEHFEALIETFDEAPEGIMPYFGSIILKELGGPDSGEYLVIDGQQRCTTFSVLIRAMLDVCIDSSYLSATQITRLTDCIYSVEEDADGDEIYLTKLRPSNPDKKSFEEVMKNEGRPIVVSDEEKESIKRAYKYFYNYFKLNSDKIKAFYKRLVSDNNSIIKITLTANDDEQKIFDSVNSLGKSLSNADIIKNYIFQKLRENAKGDQVKIDKVIMLYNDLWDSLFYAEDKKEFWYDEMTLGRIRTDNLECFLKDFAIIKKIYFAKKTTGSYGLCTAYKKYINDISDDELREFVKEINAYAQVYYNYKKGYQNQNEFIWSDYQNRLILVLDYLDTNTFNPYVLKVLKEKPDESEKRFLNLERFLLKRFIFDGTTKNYNQVCEKLLSVDDDLKYLKEYMSDSPVGNDSYKVKFRKFNNNQARMLLFLIEMFYRKGEEDKYSDTLCINKFTLEHIMPQKWQAAWFNVASYDEMGKVVDRNDVEKFVQGRNRAVRSLGNMTLLTAKLNTAISNSNFETKIDGKSTGSNNGGIRKFGSCLVTTKAIIYVYDHQKRWDERDIYEYEDKYYDALNLAYDFASM